MSARPLFVLPDGFQRLVDYGAHAVGQTFHWGVTDCWALARDGLRALTGAIDFGDDLPKYWTPAQAAGVAALATDGHYLPSWGFHRVPSLRERQRGDLLVMDGEHGLPAVRLLVDTRVLVAEEGVRSYWGLIMDEDAPVRVWRVS